MFNAAIFTSRGNSQITPTGTPVLSNFRIENAEPSKVYFDSSSDITGLTTTGFVISNNSISSVTIDGDGFGGYFTVSTPFDFWDNGTIRLGEITDANDRQSTLHNFTLQHIVNNINEPEANVIKYVSPTGTGNGSSEAAAASLTYALANAVAGETWMILAGTYGTGSYSLANSGTPTSPIKFIGYNNVAQNVNRTRVYNMSFNSSIMPLIQTSQINFSNRDNIIIKNLQHDGITAGSDNQGMVFEGCENVYVYNVYSQQFRNNFFTFRGNTVTNMRIKRVFTRDSDNANIHLSMDYGLIEDVYACSTSESPENDYFINVYGTPLGKSTIVKNNYIRRHPGLQHQGHGISIKADQHYSGVGQGWKREYDLVEGNTVENVGGAAMEFRHSEVQYGVFRGNTMSLKDQVDVTTIGSYTGIRWTGGSYNVVENNTFDSYEYVFRLSGSVEDPEAIDAAHNNIIRNNIITDTKNFGAIVIWQDVDGEAGLNRVMNHNKFYNNTILDYADLTYNTTGAVGTGNEFKNNIVINVPDYLGSGSSIFQTFDSNLFFNSEATGSNQLSIDPQLDGDYVPQAALSGLFVGRLTYYDYNRNERGNPTTVGAILHADEDTSSSPPT